MSTPLSLPVMARRTMPPLWPVAVIEAARLAGMAFRFPRWMVRREHRAMLARIFRRILRGAS